MGGFNSKERIHTEEEETIVKMEAPFSEMPEKDPDSNQILDLKDEIEDMEEEQISFSSILENNISNYSPDFKLELDEPLSGTSLEVLPQDVTSKTPKNFQEASETCSEKSLYMMPHTTHNRNMKVDCTSKGRGRIRKKEASDDHDVLYEEYRARSNVRVIRRGGEQFFACRSCAKMFKSMAAIGNHILRHPKSQPRFTCQVCDQEFRYKSELEDHYSSHKYTYSCTMCTRKFSSGKKLSKHRKSHFQNEKGILAVTERIFGEETKTNRNATLKEKTQKFECKRCNFSVFDASVFTEHTKKHARESMHVCLFPINVDFNSCENKEITPDDDSEKRQKRSLPSCTITKYECKRCADRCANHSVWLEHIKSHAMTQQIMIRLPKLKIEIL